MFETFQASVDMDTVELVEFLEACFREFLSFVNGYGHGAVSNSSPSKFIGPTYFIELVIALCPSIFFTVSMFPLAK